MRLAASICLLALLATAGRAAAQCSVTQMPTASVQLQEGYNGDAVTKNHGAWDQSFMQVTATGTDKTAAYVQGSSNTRFSQTDSSYDGGVYFPVGPTVSVNLDASGSPTHRFMPSTAESASFDARAADGYGVQGGYAQRNFDTQIVDVTSIGADKYTGDDHVSLLFTLARLSSAPGQALETTVAYSRSFPCDTARVSLSAGRDVELTGVGSNVAIYQAISYDVDEVHWFTTHFAIEGGTGWYVLNGAYNRLEVRLALRERL